MHSISKNLREKRKQIAKRGLSELISYPVKLIQSSNRGLFSITILHTMVCAVPAMNRHAMLFVPHNKPIHKATCVSQAEAT